MGRRAGDGVLHLRLRAVGIEGRQHPRRDLRRTAFCHAGERVVDRARGIGQVRRGRDLRRIVHVGDLDADRGGVRRLVPAVDRFHVETGASHLGAVAHEAQAGAARRVGEQRRVDERAGGQGHPGAAAQILQRATGRQGGDPEAQCVRTRRVVVVGEVVAAAIGQRGAAGTVLRGPFETRLAGGVVRVADLQHAAGDADRAVLGHHGIRRTDHGGRIVRRRHIEGERGVPVVGHQRAVAVDKDARRRRQPDGRLEVFAGAVVLVANVAGVQVRLGEGVVHVQVDPPARDLALDRAVPVGAAVGQAEDGVDHLARRHAVDHVAEVWVGARRCASNDDAAVFVQYAARAAGGVGAGMRRARLDGRVDVREKARRVAGRGGCQPDREIESVKPVVADAVWIAQVVVDAAHACDAGAIGIPANADRVVDHLELEGVGVACSGALGLDILDSPVDHVVDRENAADRKQLAIEQQGALVEAALGCHREREPTVDRVDVGRVQHRGGQRDGIRPCVTAGRIAGRRHRRFGGQRPGVRRIVVDRAHRDRDVGFDRRAGCAGAAAGVRHDDLEAVDEGIGARASVVAGSVVSIGEAGPRVVGDDEPAAGGKLCRRDRVRHRVVHARAIDQRGPGEVQRAVGRQPGDAHGERAGSVVAAAIGHDEVADLRQRRASAVHGIAWLAFENDAQSADRRSLIDRRDGQGDGCGGGRCDRRRAVVGAHAEAVRLVLRGTGGGMDVMNVAIDHVLLREYRADAQANAVQREVAVLRICGDAVDNL